MKGDFKMEKVITFSNEEKSLIWQRFIQPASGTEDEAKHFIEVCEIFGLNPLLGDVVFQRYETRQGPRVNFITTRDGLLRIAMAQQDFVGTPNSAVVKEGDHFKLDPSTGTVEHQFGTKRGKILGAWARMEHKRFKPVSVFVDFDEYFKANAQSQQSKGGSPIWDKMPSAMIQKIAEVFVLRRQFPLGGLTTAEEMGFDNLSSDNEGQDSPNVITIQPSKEKQSESPKNEEKNNTKAEQTSAPKEEKREQINKQLKKEEKKKESTKEDIQQEKSTSSESSNEALNGEEFTLVDMDIGKSPNGVQFAKIFVQELQAPILAKGEEGVNEANKIEGGKGDKIYLETVQENGFTFLKKVINHKAVA